MTLPPAETSASSPDPAGRERKDQLLAAAAQMIVERGYANTRIVDVARTAGISPALVVYYFGTKENLLIEALRYSEVRFFVSIEEMLAEPMPVRERLRRLVEINFQGDEVTPETPGSWSLWLDLWSQAIREERAAEVRRSLDERWRALVREALRQAQAAGEIEPQIDIAFAAAALGAILDGFAIQVVLGDPAVDDLARIMDCANGFAMSLVGLTE